MFMEFYCTTPCFLLLSITMYINVCFLIVVCYVSNSYIVNGTLFSKVKSTIYT
jgi:hypothetical protein